MIKIIVTLVCAFSSMLMLIISMATTYWIQWVIPNPAHGTNLTSFQGLLRQCWELRNNVTDELVKDGCEEWFTKSPPDYIVAVIVFLVLALICHFVAFIAGLVNGCRKGDPFPVLFVGILFIVASVFVIIALLVYTFMNWKGDVFFSWSYGGGWSTVALSIIAFVLIMADR